MEPTITGNPVRGANSVIFPSGLTNGNVGTLTVTALYTECAGFTNTSSSAPLFYGTPILSNPQVNGGTNQSFNVIPGGWANLSVAGQGVGSYSWTIEGGSGSLSPNGSSCQVSFSSFVRVVVTPSNRCGQGTNYRQTFYLSTTSAGGFYRIYPNPSKDVLSIEFENVEAAGYLFESATLLDEKDKVIRQTGMQKGKDDAKDYFKKQNSIKWDVKDIPRGSYFVHLKMGDEITKSKIILE